jgi:hypothetical protein
MQGIGALKHVISKAEMKGKQQHGSYGNMLRLRNGLDYDATEENYYTQQSSY